MAADLPKHFAEEMGRLIGPNFPTHLGLAVSGGGDSMAMLHLAAPWARVMGIKLWVVTVDHGLRAESPAEAEMVAQETALLGLDHATLRWRWDGQGNVQASAREARLTLINRWRGGVGHVLFAHTQDDLAETFLMRLARGSGVDGLSAMADRHAVALPTARVLPLGPEEITAAALPPKASNTEGFELLRPLLRLSREALRHYLQVLKIDYVDDPSNDDPKFDRVRMRQALPQLAELGLTPERLAQTAEAMGRAREVLSQVALQAHHACKIKGPGEGLFDVAYDRDLFAGLARETQLRLLAAALQFVSMDPYRPRLSALEDALDRALSGGATTLHGGYVYPHGGGLYICAEYARVKDVRAQDGYWRGIFGIADADIRPLGEAGAAQLRDQTDLPARVLWPAPAVWDGEKLCATPRLGPNAYWNPDPATGRLERLLTTR